MPLLQHYTVNILNTPVFLLLKNVAGASVTALAWC